MWKYSSFIFLWKDPVHKLPCNLGKSPSGTGRQKKSSSTFGAAKVLKIFKQKFLNYLLVGAALFYLHIMLSFTHLVYWLISWGLSDEINILWYQLVLYGSLSLLTLYSFHFADEDVATTLANFLDPESPTVQVEIPWLLKYCNTQHKSAKFVCNLLAITISYRDGFKKSKWKFKMAFAIRRPII